MRKLSIVAVPALVLALALGCTAEVEDPGTPPEIDVRPGEAPEIDIQPADIEISRDTQTIVTPDVDVVPRNP